MFVLRLHRIPFYIMENTTVIQKDNTNILEDPSVTLTAFFLVFFYKLLNIIVGRNPYLYKGVSYPVL